METKALWHIDKMTSEIRNEKAILNEIENPIFIKSEYSSISLGTEKLVSAGKIPVELFDKMKVPYMAGNFDFPIKYGYSLIGQTQENKWVHLMHPHQTGAFVNAEDCYFFSDEIEPLLATQFSNLETIVNAIWTSKVNKNDTVLICGTGSVGILLAQTIKMHIGAKVFIQENNSVKRGKLIAFGFELCNGKNEYSISYNVSADEKGLQYCINHGAIEGKIIELSWYGNQAVSLQLGGDFHYKRLQIVSSQVSEIPNEMKELHTFKSRKTEVENLLKTVDYKPFISSVIPFDELPFFFEKVRKNQPNDDFITVVKY